MGLTNLRLIALVLMLASTPTILWAQPQSPGALDVPQDPPLQRPQPVPQSSVPRTLPAQPLHSTMPTPTNLAPPPTLVPPAMIPPGQLPPGVTPGSSIPVPMPSPR